MSAQTVQHLGALHPMSTMTTPTAGKPQQSFIPSFTPLYEAKGSRQVEQAIDTLVEAGKNANRKFLTVMTPNGPKRAVVLSDELITPCQADYLLKVPAPEMSNVWSELKTVALNAPAIPQFNARTHYINRLFWKFHSHAIVRLVAKPPLFSAQRFYVGWNPNSTVSSNYSAIGFDWNPSEDNEVYVILPWVLLTHVASCADFASDTLKPFGAITITPVTDLVFADGSPSTLPITMMSCPYDLTMYDPRAVSLPATRSLLAPSNGKDQFPHFEVAEEQGLSSDCLSGLNLLCQKHGLEFPQFSTGVQSAIGAWTVTSSWAVGSNPIYGSGTGSTKKIAKQLSCVDLISTGYKRSSTWTKSSLIDLQDATLFSVDFLNLKDSYCKTDDETDVALSFRKRLERTRLEKKPFKLCPEEAEEQIFEYEYNGLSDQADADYGESQDFAERVCSHWQFVKSQSVSDTTGDFSFDVNLQTLNSATSEANRHLYMSRMPLLKLNTTSNPGSTALYRVTCHPRGNTGSTMQMPGQEWDIKTGDYVFQPYWIDMLSALSIEDYTATIRLKLISGSIGVPFFVTMWMNTSPLKYHHMMDPDVVEEAFEQGETFPESDPAPSENPELDVSHTSPANAEILQVESVGPVESERDWKFVMKTIVDPVVNGIVQIPITTSLFGKYNWWNARRYYKWKGTPRFKIMTTAASTTNAQLFIAHTNVLAKAGADPEARARMFPCAKASVSEASVELATKWRAKTPTLTVRASDGPAQNGYLDICIVQNTASLVSGASNTIQVSIFCDVGEVKYSHPVYNVSDSWVAPVANLIPRTPALKTPGYSERVVSLDVVNDNPIDVVPFNSFDIVGVRVQGIDSWADGMEIICSSYTNLRALFAVRVNKSLNPFLSQSEMGEEGETYEKEVIDVSFRLTDIEYPIVVDLLLAETPDPSGISRGSLSTEQVYPTVLEAGNIEFALDVSPIPRTFPPDLRSARAAIVKTPHGGDVVSQTTAATKRSLRSLRKQ